MRFCLILFAIAVSACSAPPDPASPNISCATAEGTPGDLTFSEYTRSNVGRQGFNADRFDQNSTPSPYRISVYALANGTSLQLDVYLPEAPRLRTSYPVTFWAQGGTPLPAGSAALDYRETSATTLPLRWWSSTGTVRVTCSTPRGDMPGYSVVVLGLEDAAMQAVPQTPSTGTFKIAGRIKASAVTTP